MKIKTVISLFSAGVCAIAVQQAQAISEISVLTGTTEEVTSSVSGPVAGLYTYTYTVSLIPSDIYIAADAIQALTVNNAMGGTGFFTSGITAIGTTAPGWSGSVTASPVGHVLWNDTPPSDMNVIGDSFSFESPYGPTQGVVFAQDNNIYPGASPVYVPTPPSTPDGGLTVALLGGALAAMSFIRSKTGKQK